MNTPGPDTGPAAPDLATTERVLVLAPTLADAQLTEKLLGEAGLDCVVCRDVGALAAGIVAGAGAVVVTDQSLADPRAAEIAAAIRAQPGWSDVPVLVLSGAKNDGAVAHWAQASLGNVTVLERPVRLTTLVSAMRSAIRGRRRQYQLRDQITDLADAGASLRRQGERLRMLWEAASLLLAADDADAMVRDVFARIAPPLGLDVCLRFDVDDRGELRLRGWAGLADDQARAFARLGPDLAACRADPPTTAIVVTEDIASSPDPALAPLRALGMRTYACSPLVIGGRALGTLSFGSRQKDRFADDEIAFLGTIRDYVTLAYERLRLIAELKNTHQRKDEFLATLAHELRNPLAPIGNAVEILRLVSRDPARVEHSRRMIERQLAQMVRLIDDLLDVSRITRGKLELRPERVELAPIIEQAVDIARPLIDESHHTLAVVLPPAPVYLVADAVRLAQVLSNLLNNSAKYMPRGGRISLVATADEAEATITVTDAGVGIPSHALHAIFEMFVQVDPSLERARGGLGIGLTLVKRLTEMHGGTVEARSEGPGRGSEFTVRLPVAPPVAQPAEASAGDAPAADRSPPRRVLVADDNRDAADSLGQMLRLMGHEVRIAGDGIEALAAARDFRPDLALLDIGMPGLNGYETARRIRETPWGKAIVLIAITGWGQEQDKRAAAAAGFDRHFTKPLRNQDLALLLSDLRGPSVPAAVG